MTTTFDMQDGITLTDARIALTKLPEQLAQGQGVVPVTRNGKPVLAVMTWELYESISETLEILGDSEMMEQIREGMRQAEAGETRPWEEVKAELDL